MIPYRGRVERESVRLVVAPSTYWRRFVSHAASAVGQVAFVCCVAAVVAVALTVSLVTTDRLPVSTPGSLAFLMFETMLAGPFALCLLMAVPFRALVPGANESLLPRELTFHGDGIHVVPSQGDAFETGYGWIPVARLEARGLELRLAHDRPLSIHVSRRAIGAEAFDRIVQWLRDNQNLG